MDTNRQLKISESYLKELLDYVSRSLCGKVMKRLEISGDTQTAKTQIKEVIYEEARHLRDLLIAHSAGIDMSQFQFKIKDHNDGNAK